MISVLYVCNMVEQERSAAVRVGIFEAVVPCFITGIQSEGIQVFVYMKVNRRYF